MAKDKLRAAALGGSADEIEHVFYEALQNGDIERLMNCWSDEEDIVCVHPGGPRLLGAAAIRATFESMFANGTIQAQPKRLRKVESLTSAVHSLIETIRILTPEGPREAYVTATNVYHRTAQGWRMVVHHASPGRESEPDEIEDPPQVLH
jgi:ketosteroid isomerase-like protein